MTLDLNVRADFDAARRALTKLERRVVPQAAAMALNDARRAAAAQTRRNLFTLLDLPPRGSPVASRRMLRRFYRNARWYRLEAIFVVGTYRLPIGDYVKAGVAKGSQAIGKWQFPGSFYARLKSGHENLFERFGPKVRVYPTGNSKWAKRIQANQGSVRAQRIRKVTIEVDDEVRRAAADALDTAGAEAWGKRFKHHLTRRLRQLWAQ